MIPLAKARMGIILSSSNRMVEPQLRHFAPAGLEVHVTRMRMSSKFGRTPQQIADDIVAAARLLADAKVDVIVFQATGVAMQMGEKGEARIMAEVSDATGTIALSATQAMVEALKALSLKKLVIVSPFDQKTNDHERAYLTALGFEVLHDVGLGLEAGDRSTGVTPDRWVETVVANARPEAEGYFLSGSNTAMMEAVAPIERRLGKPAVNSTQASLWASTRRLAGKLGPVAYHKDLGRLFAQTPSA